MGNRPRICISSGGVPLDEHIMGNRECIAWSYSLFFLGLLALIICVEGKIKTCKNGDNDCLAVQSVTR